MKKIWIAVLLLLSLLMFSGCGEKVVAEVNGEAVSAADFAAYWDNLSKIYEANQEVLADDMKQTVVEQLVYDALLAQVATELDCLPSEAEVKVYYEEEMALGYGSYENGLSMVDDYDLDEDFFRHQYRCRLYEEKIMAVLGKDEDVSVSDEEAQSLYNADPDRYEQRVVSHLLVRPYAAEGRETQSDVKGNVIYTEEEWDVARKRCEELVAQLEKGKNFGDLAKKYSDDVVTADNGGRIAETIYRDSEGFDENFLTAAFGLTEPGTFTKTPVKTVIGYEIIYCEKSLTSLRMEEVLSYIKESQEEQNLRSLLIAHMKEKEAASEIVYHREVWEGIG